MNVSTKVGVQQEREKLFEIQKIIYHESGLKIGQIQQPMSL